MARRIPKYRHHKGSGQALVQIDGRRIYLGKFGSPESHDAYDRVIGEWLAAARNPDKQSGDQVGISLSITELILMYLKWAKAYYVKEGQTTQEFGAMKDALKPVRALYGKTPARSFGPRSLKAVRERMVDSGLSRGVINNRVNRIKRFFKWAVSEEHVPSSVYEGLRTVTGLKFGRSRARETKAVKPAPDEAVNKLLPFLAPPVRAMVQLQRLTGMRSGEIVIMRPCDIDRSGEGWLYQPTEHKTQYCGHEKVVPLGPKAQQVVEPFLERDPESFLFSPKESEQWRREQRPVHHKKKRKTPIYPSELRAREKLKEKRSKEKKSRLRDRYDTASYRRSVKYAFTRALRQGVELGHWHPHQLRHARATEIRKMRGVEAAQVTLGHAHVDTTEIYAERDQELAIRIAVETG